VPLDEREYMRSPDGDDDAYYRWLRDNGFVRLAAHLPPDRGTRRMAWRHNRVAKPS
jgi:hypothetical protein